MASSQTIQQYCDHLGIPINASIDEIKKAYRKKAMSIHPDVNPSQSAAAEFVKLNSYYEGLLNYKKTGYFSSPRSSKKQPYKSAAQRYREELRTKLEELERAKIRQYVYSEAYRKNYHFNTLVDWVILGGLGLFYLVVTYVFIPASRTSGVQYGEPTYTVDPTVSLIAILTLTGLLTLATLSYIKNNRRRRKAFLDKVAAYKTKHNIKD